MRESKEMTGSGAAAQGAQPRPRGPGWVRILLVLSLAVNLIGAGLLAGAWLGHDPKAGAGRRDFGLGPLAGAMTREDWRAMRPGFLAQNPDLGRGSEALEQDYLPLLTALRAGEFDAGALNAALSSLSERNAHRLASAREVIGGYLSALPPEERAQYADRLEQILTEIRMRRAEKRN